MRIFLEKAVKSPQRQWIRLKILSGLQRLGTPPPIPRIVTFTY